MFYSPPFFDKYIPVGKDIYFFVMNMNTYEVYNELMIPISPATNILCFAVDNNDPALFYYILEIEDV